MNKCCVGGIRWLVGVKAPITTVLKRTMVTAGTDDNSAIGHSRISDNRCNQASFLFAQYISGKEEVNMFDNLAHEWHWKIGEMTSNLAYDMVRGVQVMAHLRQCVVIIISSLPRDPSSF